MMRSMYSGVSGLKNHQTRMDVIGNNIANINTAGYKKSRVVFKDSLYQKLKGATNPVAGVRGGTNPMGIGLGMAVSSIDQIHTGAPATTTNKLTDMAIDGNGYFVLKNGDQFYFTRAGSFDFDDYGMLGNTSNGYSVQGWMTERQVDPVTGDWIINVQEDTSSLQAIDISGFKDLEPSETTEMRFGGNLDSALEYNEIQTLTFNPTAEGGTAGEQFYLSFDGQQTALINVGANTATTAANIQNALEQLSNIGEGNVAVEWDSTNNNYRIKFQEDLASIDVATVGFSPAFNGTAGTPAVSESQAGDSGTSTDEIDNLDLGGATQGFYTLTYGGTDTVPIAYNANAAEIQAALEGIAALTGNVTVADDGAGGFDITFDSSLDDVTLTVAVFSETSDPGTVTNYTPDATFIPQEDQCVIRSMEVYDSLGTSQTVYFRFYKYEIEAGTATTDTVSRWACDISLNPLFDDPDGGYSATAPGAYISRDITAPAPATLNAGSPQILRLYNLEFDDLGQVVGGSSNPLTLTLDRTALGAQNIEYTIDFSELTQYDGESSAKPVYQDGYPMGSLIGYTIGIDGTIKGEYDNGETRSLARVALANFENPSGMIQTGGTLFQESGNSGKPQIGAPGSQSMGDIVPSSLEMSNVDLSEEFTDMIVTQRGFQANSRIITTSDEMIQELVNLKR